MLLPVRCRKARLFRVVCGAARRNAPVARPLELLFIMKLKTCLLAGLIASGASLLPANATDRLFTYTYEPETMPAGAAEFEQWVTWRGDRNKAVGQDDFSRWEFRTEYEHALTDRYTVSLYGLQGRQESFREPAGNRKSDFHWDGVSVENLYMVLNPAENPVGLSLYLEPRMSDRDAELEQKIIIGISGNNDISIRNLIYGLPKLIYLYEA